MEERAVSSATSSATYLQSDSDQIYNGRISLPMASMSDSALIAKFRGGFAFSAASSLCLSPRAYHWQSILIPTFRPRLIHSATKLFTCMVNASGVLGAGSAACSASRFLRSGVRRTAPTSVLIYPPSLAAAQPARKDRTIRAKYNSEDLSPRSSDGRETTRCASEPSSRIPRYGHYLSLAGALPSRMHGSC